MAKDSLKVVVRLLPPEITEDEFRQTVPEGHLRRTRWSGFHAGKRYKGEAKPSLNSRCYFQFDTLEHAEEFIKDYHGHQFVDSQGEPFRAVACFAPYQKVPRQKAQKDPRDGTIGDDLAYKEFVEKLSAKSSYEAPPNPVTLLKPADYGDTPLLNYLKNRSRERRARTERRDKKRWRDGPGGLEPVAEEDPKRARWRCAECGTSKHLEEDPDDRGTFYCTYCWESWENQPSASKVKKKKKKKVDDGEDDGREETDRSKRKKQEKERDGTAESSSHKAEWRAKDTVEGKVSSASCYGDEDDRDRRHRKKKKKAEDEADDADAGGGHASLNRWRVKPAVDETGEWDRDRHRSRRGAHKDTRDDWWAEPMEEPAKHSNRRPERGDKVDDGRGATRWRAKAPATAAEDDGGEREERPRRSRKDKTHSDESSEYWVPKCREAS